MSDGIGRILREHRVAEALLPAEVMRQQRAAERVIDPLGGIRPEAARAFRTPLTFHWHVGGALGSGPQGGVRECPRAGSVTRIGVHAETAPSGASLVVLLTKETEGSGATTIASVTVAVGTRVMTVEVSEAITAGTWLGIDVAQAGNAEGLSVTVTVERS